MSNTKDYICFRFHARAMLILVLLSTSMLSLPFDIPKIDASEPPAIEWYKIYGGAYRDYANSLVETSDGGFALAGRTRSFGAGGNDMWLVKTDPLGNMEWNRTYGGTSNEDADSLVETSDGGFALAGRTDSATGGSWYNFWLVKTDSLGNMEWNRTWGGANDESASSVIQTVDGGYAVAGYTSPPGLDSDYWLIRTDSLGNVQWNRTYGGDYDDWARSVVETSDGGFVLAGTSRYDFWLVKVDSVGNMEWNKTYTGEHDDYLSSVVETSDGGFALAGKTYIEHDDSEFWLVKVDSSGNMEWNKKYGGEYEDGALSAVETSDGGFALAGFTGFKAPYPPTNESEDADFWLVKTDSLGNMEWNRTWGGEGYDYAHAVVETSERGYAMAGRTDSFGAGEFNYDFSLVKVARICPVHNIDSGLDYATIQEAIDAPETVNGHTIHVDAGIYTEHVTLHKSLSLVGEDRNRPHVTIVDGNLTGTVMNVTVDEVSIIGFAIQNSGPSPHSGIYVGDLSTEVNISSNIVNSNGYGIRLFYSTNNIIADNYVSDNTYGVILENSGNNTLIRNRIGGNEYDFGVYGETLPDFYQDINISNRASAGPIYYLVNQNGLTVDPLLSVGHVGYFAAVNSTNITLSSFVLGRNIQGVLLAYTNNSLVEHVETTNNVVGIWLHHSVNNSIIGNTISNNIEGVHITNSSNNAIYDNSFVGNVDQTMIDELDNMWDDGYPSGGNYWSDHTGVDEKSGPAQDQSGSDGIIDTPYVIDENNQDNYPLKESWFNIAISNILPSKTTTNDTIVYIAVLIQVPLDFREPLEINVYANSTLIATRITEPYECMFPLFLIFPVRLNTTLMLKGSYLMSANVTSVLNETYTADNTYGGGTFREVFLGDINHDGIGNILDISTVAMAYPSWTIREDVNHDGIVNYVDMAIVVSAFGSDPAYEGWNPDADIDENGQVNIVDTSELATHFGWMATAEWNQNVDWNNDLVINILDLSAAAINFGKTDL